MLKALYLLDTRAYDVIYGPDERADLAALLDTSAPPQTAESIRLDPSALADVEVILSGWGCPALDAALLDAAPKLQAVFYGAGSIRGIVTDAFWERNIPITSSYAANAVPVAEFTLAQIIFCLKRGWQHVFAIRSAQSYPERMPVPGAYGSTVGLVSLGMIGRMVARAPASVRCAGHRLRSLRGRGGRRRAGRGTLLAGRRLSPRRRRLAAHALAAGDGGHDHGRALRHA